jgi:uncharacterized protein
MKLSGTYQFKAPRQKVWEALNNPDVLSKCIPGCEKLERTDGDNYTAHLKVGVAAIKGSYTGKVSLKDIVPPNSYTLHVEGKGGPGFLKGASKIQIADEDGGTEVKFEADMQIGGLIASVGSRMVEGVGKMLADQFFKALAAQVDK